MKTLGLRRWNVNCQTCTSTFTSMNVGVCHSWTVGSKQVTIWSWVGRGGFTTIHHMRRKTNAAWHYSLSQKQWGGIFSIARGWHSFQLDLIQSRVFRYDTPTHSQRHGNNATAKWWGVACRHVHVGRSGRSVVTVCSRFAKVCVPYK